MTLSEPTEVTKRLWRKQAAAELVERSVGDQRNSRSAITEIRG